VRGGVVPADAGHLEHLLRPDERQAPIVTVLDAASHALAFLGSVLGQPVVPLGLETFGQSGGRAAVYHYAGIDADHVVNAALAALALGPDAV
jgi:pyruvate dehydrogenase E1 component